MKYSNMIKTENTAEMYEAWSGYRNDLTTYISDAIKGNIPIDSWVAIWGAGGCNDIDIAVLSQSYKLLLIDRDLKTLEQVRDRLGLAKERCRIADVGFWTIEEEDYKLFEALLMDRADQQELETFLEDIVKNMPSPASLENYQVDCSVVVGLASQLNVRLAALLYMYKEKLNHIDMNSVKSLLDRLNILAVERLYVAVRQLTKTLVITGYELECLPDRQLAELKGVEYSEAFHTGIDSGSYLSGAEGEHISVAGNEHWHHKMYKAILMDKLEELGFARILYWDFCQGKCYVMLNLALLVR